MATTTLRRFRMHLNNATQKGKSLQKQSKSAPAYIIIIGSSHNLLIHILLASYEIICTFTGLQIKNIVRDNLDWGRRSSSSREDREAILHGLLEGLATQNQKEERSNLVALRSSVTHLYKKSEAHFRQSNKQLGLDI